MIKIFITIFIIINTEAKSEKRASWWSIYLVDLNGLSIVFKTLEQVKNLFFFQDMLAMFMV